MFIEIESYEIDGGSKARNYHVAAFCFECKTSEFDRKVIDMIVKKLNKVLQNINPAFANESRKTRNLEEIKADIFVGLLAEYAWKYFINLSYADVIVKETEFKSKENQIDLIVSRSNSTIEIRSSIVLNGIDFALKDENSSFHLIGPYSNSVKPNEVPKDFYLGALCHYSANKKYIINSAKKSSRIKPFSIHIIGGATLEMMRSSDKAYGFSSGDVNNGKSDYSAINFKNTKDVGEISEIIYHNSIGKKDEESSRAKNKCSTCGKTLSDKELQYSDEKCYGCRKLENS